MNKHQSPPSSFADGNSAFQSENAARSGHPEQGEAAQRQRRPRAPQFGTDRRNQRDLDARRPKSARHHGDADGLARFAPEPAGNTERRKTTEDRRQTWTQNVRKEALR